jgi:site-specific DNA recombinase
MSGKFGPRGCQPRTRTGETTEETQPEDLDAAIYARTSSGSQRFGYSIDEQVNQCWDQCTSADWTVKYIFTDEAQSGRDTDRPQFQQLLECAEEGVIDVVVFWKLDRFCRSLSDLVRIEDQLRAWDVGLQSVTEYIDTTTPVGRFNFRNLASAAELESDLTSQRVKMGMHGFAKEHKWPNKHPPLGYTKLDSDKLEIITEEAHLVRRIFTLYLRERSMPEVAYSLNAEDIFTKQGNEWCRQSINTVLSNELYTGSYSVAGFEDHVEEYRIISDERFSTVEDVRYRFQRGNNEMAEARKQSKAERILEQYKKIKEDTP